MSHTIPLPNSVLGLKIWFIDLVSVLNMPFEGFDFSVPQHPLLPWKRNFLCRFFRFFFQFVIAISLLLIRPGTWNFKCERSSDPKCAPQLQDIICSIGFCYFASLSFVCFAYLYFKLIQGVKILYVDRCFSSDLWSLQLLILILTSTPTALLKRNRVSLLFFTRWNNSRNSNIL